MLALRDTDGDGRADQTAQFGTGPGNGIYFKTPFLYFAPNDRIERYLMSPASLTPVAGPDMGMSPTPHAARSLFKQSPRAPAVFIFK